MNDEHLGWRMMRRIHTTLRIDEAWTEWHDDGFTWWAHKVAQRFRFEGPVDVSGVATWWASFETDFLKSVRGDPVAALGDDPVSNPDGRQHDDPGGDPDGRPDDDPSGRPSDAMTRASQRADDLNRKHGVFTAAPVGTRLVLRNRTYALEETMAHRCWQLGERALFANILANRVVNAIDAGTSTWEAGIVPDVSGHPRNRARSLPDEMLNVIDDVYRAKDMVMRAPDVAEAVATLEMGGFVRTEERYAGQVAAGAVALARHDGTWGGPIVVVIEPGHADPVFGPGLRVRSYLPGAAKNVDEARFKALALNEAEWTTHEPLVGTGAWSAGPVESDGSSESPGSNGWAGPDRQAGPDDLNGHLVHTSFYPRASLAQRFVVGAVMEELAHGVWGGAAKGAT